jgi:hypothetical protein
MTWRKLVLRTQSSKRNRGEPKFSSHRAFRSTVPL